MIKLDDIYHDYFSDVYKYTLKICGNEDLASEITQQTFFKAMFSLHKFRGECDVKVWLLRIAKNTLYSLIRKHKKQISLLEYDLQSEDRVEDIIEDRDTARRIRAILENMQEPYKEVFTMRVIAELPFDVIGSAFGKNAHWACVTYHRAKEKIKNRLED